MGLLEVINISHSFGDKILYKNSSFELFKGEHMGLVGQNGTGKTTLLNSLIGNVIPDEGEIRWQKGIKVGYLDQHAKIDKNLSIFEYLKEAFSKLYKIESELNAIYEKMSNNCSEDIMETASDHQMFLVNNGFYEIESTILKVADGLGITALGVNNQLGNLSGGQRAKVILAKLLLENPDILLLDEPTNFLDKEHIEWLTEYLRAFKGAFIVISHDYDFLDKVTTCICDIELYKIKKYTGNFSKFIKLKEIKKESYLIEFQTQQKQIKKYEDYIAKNKARASTAAMAKSRQKQLDKIDRLDPPKSDPKPNFKLTSLPITTNKTLVVKDLQIGYYYPLLPKMNFEIISGQKTVITGFNGIGKSTLLKTLVGQIPAISGGFSFADNIKIGYFEQDLKWDDATLNPVKIVSDKFSAFSEKQIRKHLAQCGLKSKNALQSVSTLSGGEQTKVKLCILMLTKANLLILDEPTNHIDVDTKKVLMDELKKWEGSIILVSHDPSFYKDWCDKIIDINKLG